MSFDRNKISAAIEKVGSTAFSAGVSHARGGPTQALRQQEHQNAMKSLIALLEQMEADLADIPDMAGVVNWHNLESVKSFADKFGPGQLVIRHDDRSNFNIVHAARRDRWDRKGVTVWYASKGTPMPCPIDAILK